MIRTAAFFALLLFCVTPWYSPPIALALVRLSRIGLTITLFLIGASLTRRSLAAVGVYGR